jgi:multidrug resistance efflux pump
LKRLLFVVPLLVLVSVAFVWLRKNQPTEIEFARARRETLISSLFTNGKVEPLVWRAIRADSAGRVSRLAVEAGARVRKGQIIAQLDTAGLEAELAAAEARIDQTKAELDRLREGGDARVRAEIDGSLATVRFELETARRDAESLERLVRKQAATASELNLARQRVRDAELRIASLESRREALVVSQDRTVAAARLRDAEAAARLVRQNMAGARLATPIAGVIYHIPVRAGAVLNAGDLVAEVGDVSQLRVRVYVDEPELGRVDLGMPVVITWDARPGEEWRGAVERLPAQIVSLGTRQVGEVTCRIADGAAVLPPGANIDAEVRSKVVENALTIPKECLRRQGDATGVFVLEGSRLRWQPVTQGAASLTRVEIVEGLADGVAVALPSEVNLSDGMEVQAGIR